MRSKVVITGIGAITPYGIGIEPLWQALLEGKSALRALPERLAGHLRCQFGGYWSEFQPEEHLSPRLTRRLDRFTVFALLAARLALKDAGVAIEDLTKSIAEDAPDPYRHAEGRDRIGLMVGNNLGGWEFAECELRHLWRDGIR